MIDYIGPKDGPVVPGEELREVIYARDQREYLPLRTLRGSVTEVPVLSRWSPTPEQRQAIVEGKDIFLNLFTFGRPLQPIQMFVASDEDSTEIMQIVGIKPIQTDYGTSEITHMTCRSRMEQQGPWEYREGLDKWEYSPNGDRTCSFCGSLHPEDFMDLVRKAAAGEPIEVEPSDKTYKIYVGRQSVKNASEGGIKFYTWHLPTISDEDRELFAQAVANTRKRFEETMQRNYPG
jgi:hypothetical protein